MKSIEYLFLIISLSFLVSNVFLIDTNSKDSKSSQGDLSQNGVNAHITSISQEHTPVLKKDQYHIFSPLVQLDPELNVTAIPYNETLEIVIPEIWLKFNPNPDFIEDCILYLNFDNAFYDYDHFNHSKIFLKEPEFTVWIASMQSNLLKYSNRRLIEAGLRMGIQVMPVDTEQFRLIAFNDESSTVGSNFQLQYNGIAVELPDIVLSRIGSKVSHFSMTVLFHLEKMGVQVLNGFEAHVTTADKLFQLQQLAQSSFPIPKSLLLGDPMGRNEDKMKILSNEFKFPVIVKKLRGLQGRGIMLVEDIEHFNDLEQIMDDKQPYLVQEYISLSHGRDIRIFVVGGKVVGSMMRVAREGFKSNFHLGGFVKKVKLNEQLEWLAIEASNHLGLDIAGVDILMGNGTYQICEVNSSPGFMGLENATGVDIASKILTWISIKTNTFKRKT